MIMEHECDKGVSEMRDMDNETSLWRIIESVTHHLALSCTINKSYTGLCLLIQSGQKYNQA